MSRFADDSEVYAAIGRVMQEIASDPDIAPTFQAADTCVRYELHHPEATITVGSRGGGPVQVDLGSSDQEPEVVMSMDCDLAHQYLLGDLDLTVALARGQVVAEGPVNKILAVLPVVEPLLPRYRALVSPSNGGGSASASRSPK